MLAGIEEILLDDGNKLKVSATGFVHATYGAGSLARPIAAADALAQREPYRTHALATPHHLRHHAHRQLRRRTGAPASG